MLPFWATRDPFSLTPDSYLLRCCSLEPLGPTGHCFRSSGHIHILGPMSPAGSKPQTTTLGQSEHGGAQSVWTSCSLACSRASDMAAGPQLHLWHPRPQALMAWLSGVRAVCSGCTGHPRGLLSRACPMAQRQSPGGLASPCPPSPPQLFVTLVFCPQAAPLPKCPCWDCCLLFFTKVFFCFVFLNPFKSLGRMAQCRERSCVTELRGSHSPQNQYSCHSGCICVCVGVCYPPRSSDVHRWLQPPRLALLSCQACVLRFGKPL